MGTSLTAGSLSWVGVAVCGFDEGDLSYARQGSVGLFDRCLRLPDLRASLCACKQGLCVCSVAILKGLSSDLIG